MRVWPAARCGIARSVPAGAALLCGVNADDAAERVCRTLRYIGLAGNRLSVQSCVVLQAGLRLSRSLDTLNLDSNPLGPEGGAAMMEALARRHVGTVSLKNCNFSGAASDRGSGGGAAPVFDVQRPNRVYTLPLDSAAQYALAAVLVRYWKHAGPATWRTATLDGAVRSPPRHALCYCSDRM